MFDKEPRRGFPIGLKSVAVYLRKSREDRDAEQKAAAHGGEYDTLARHRTTLLDLAKQQNYIISHVYAEVVSGESISGRPMMTELLTEVQKGTYTSVMCMDIDRLGRGDMRDQGQILATFKESQTLIITPDKVYDLEDEMDEEMTEFKAFFSRKEYKIIRKRLERGRHQSIQQGKFIYPRTPYGYIRGDESVLQIHPEQAKIVHLIFQWYLAGFGPTMIANRLSTLGVPSPLGKSNWWPEQIVFMLRNPIYQGQIRHGHQQRHRLRKKPTEIYNGMHEGIIPPVDFERVQSKIGKPTAPGPKRPKNPLRGLVICAFCGKPYQFLPVTNRPEHRLHCDTPACGGGSLSITSLEDAILEQLQQQYDQLNVEPTEVDTDRSAVDVIDMQIEQAQKELSQLDTQRRNAFDLLERQVYTVEIFAERQKDLGDRIAEISALLLTLETEKEHQIKMLDQRLDWLPALVNVLDLYRDTEGPYEKNELLRQILDRAVLRKEKSSRAFELDLYLRMPARGDRLA